MLCNAAFHNKVQITFCGASCSDTRYLSSDAFGKCGSFSLTRSWIAVASADLSCRGFPLWRTKRPPDLKIWVYKSIQQILYKFRQAKLCYGGWLLGSSQFPLLSELLQKNDCFISGQKIVEKLSSILRSECLNPPLAYKNW